MEGIKNLYKKYREFVVYMVVGLLTTLVSTVIYLILTFLWGDNDTYVTISTVISWFIAATFAFFMNKLVVFKSMSMDKHTFIREALETYGARIFSLFLEVVGLWFFNTVIGLRHFHFHFIKDLNGTLISKFIMMFVVTISNYIFSKFIVFSKKTNNPPKK